MPSNSRSARPAPTPGSWALLGLLGLIWGGAFLGVEMALTGFAPITTAAIRVSVAALILLAVGAAMGHHPPGFATPTERRI